MTSRHRALVFLLVVIVGAGAVDTPPPVEYYRIDETTRVALGRRGGTLALAVVGRGLTGFNPMLEQSNGVLQVLHLLHGRLVEQNLTTAELEPALASRWQIHEDTEYTFTLRRGVRWSDDEPFTAEDVLFTFRDVVFNPDVPTPLRELFLINGQLPTVELVDANTVRFVTPAVYAPFLRWLSFVPILPKHRLSQHVARLHPPGAKQALGKAKVIVTSIFRDRARVYVGEDRYQALETGLTELAQALDAQDVARIAEVVGSMETTLGTVEANLPKGEQAQALTDDELYRLSLLGLAIVNLRRELYQVRDQAQADNFDAVGVREDTFAQTWSQNVSLDQLTGLGPFRVRVYEHRELVLERNPYYWKQDTQGTVLPYLDELHVRFVDEPQQALADFDSSKTQLFFPRTEDLPRLATSERFALSIGGPTFGVNFIVFNQDTPDPALRAVFRDLAFRKAVAHALDRPRLIEEALHRVGVVLDGPVCPGSPFHAQGLIVYDHDPQRAAALLDGAGYLDRNGDGLREDASGQPLHFELITNQNNPLRVRTVQLLQAALGQLGIEVSIKLMEFNTLIQTVFNGAYQGAVLGLTGGIDPHGGVNMWRLGGALRLWRLRSVPEAWEQQVDTLFQQAVSTLDLNVRRALYDEFQRLVVEHLPVIYTVEPSFAMAYHPSVGNATMHNALSSPLRPAEFWFLQ
ncbi:MAG: ABC transporter substrate-binding protein [Candidatus Bipolaricaulia bacterium]